MAQNSFWEVVFDNLSQGIYILDHAGNYIYCNRAFLDMVEADREDILQLNTFQLVPEGQVSKSVGASALEQKQQLTIINTVVTPKGLRYRQLATATPIFDNMGEVVYVLVETTRLEEITRRYQTALLVEGSGCVDLYTGASVTPAPPAEVVAESPAMQALLELAGHLAQVDVTVLLTGETGSGKEVLAQYLHRHSPRSDRELVEINCAALPENLLEAELFGYERGAFTGALNTGKPGLVERADGGTLFLDEINSLPLALQGKLLRLLESRRSKRLGAVEERTLDFRLLCATNQNLKELVDAGRFRADLYYRLSVVPLNIPPLRERREDIIPLSLRFLDQFCQKYGRTRVFTQGVFDQLLAYDWPGNVRELRNVVERLVITSTAGTVEIYQAPDNLISGGSPAPAAGEQLPLSGDWLAPMEDAGFSLPGFLEQCERAVLAQALRQFGSTYRAAEHLGVNQSTVARKKLKYGL